MPCSKRRENDEWTCLKCKVRWDVDTPAPPSTCDDAQRDNAIYVTHLPERETGMSKVTEETLLGDMPGNVAGYTVSDSDPALRAVAAIGLKLNEHSMSRAGCLTTGQINAMVIALQYATNPAMNTHMRDRAIADALRSVPSMSRLLLDMKVTPE